MFYLQNLVGMFLISSLFVIPEKRFNAQSSTCTTPSPSTTSTAASSPTGGSTTSIKGSPPLKKFQLNTRRLDAKTTTTTPGKTPLKGKCQLPSEYNYGTEARKTSMTSSSLAPGSLVNESLSKRRRYFFYRMSKTELSLSLYLYLYLTYSISSHLISVLFEIVIAIVVRCDRFDC